jgi:hypothetical protein
MPLDLEILRMGIALRRVEWPTGFWKYLQQRKRDSRAKLKDYGAVELDLNNKLFLAFITGKISRDDFFEYLSTPENLLTEGQFSSLHVKFSSSPLDEHNNPQEIRRIFEGFDIDRLAAEDEDEEIQERSVKAAEVIDALLRNPLAPKIYLTVLHYDYVPSNINEFKNLFVKQGVCGVTINDCSVLQPNLLYLLQSLRAKDDLEVIGINRNGRDLGNEGLYEILHLMRKPSLREVSMESIFVRASIKPELFREMLQIITTSQHLESFSFSGNYVGPSASAMLALAIGENESLLTLNIANISFGHEAAEILAASLVRNKTLRKLDLSGNPILIDGARHIAHGLRINSKLKNLNLANCELQDEGVAAIAEALSNNQTLEKLNIAGNNVSAIGATAMALALKVNLALTHVDFGEENHITLPAQIAVREAIFISNEVRKEILGAGFTPLSVNGIAGAQITDERQAELRLEVQQIIAAKSAAKAQGVELRDDASRLSDSSKNKEGGLSGFSS